MDLDAAVLVQHDLPAGTTATGGLDVTLVELADEYRDSTAEFDLLGAGGPPMAPSVDGESVGWWGQVRADGGVCCSFQFGHGT
jgi:hypothetical protein